MQVRHLLELGEDLLNEEVQSKSFSNQGMDLTVADASQS